MKDKNLEVVDYEYIRFVKLPRVAGDKRKTRTWILPEQSLWRLSR